MTKRPLFTFGQPSEHDDDFDPLLGRSVSEDALARAPGFDVGPEAAATTPSTSDPYSDWFSIGVTAPAASSDSAALAASTDDGAPEGVKPADAAGPVVPPVWTPFQVKQQGAAEVAVEETNPLPVAEAAAEETVANPADDVVDVSQDEVPALTIVDQPTDAAQTMPLSESNETQTPNPVEIGDQASNEPVGEPVSKPNYQAIAWGEPAPVGEPVTPEPINVEEPAAEPTALAPAWDATATSEKPLTRQIVDWDDKPILGSRDSSSQDIAPKRGLFGLPAVPVEAWDRPLWGKPATDPWDVVTGKASQSRDSEPVEDDGPTASESTAAIMDAPIVEPLVEQEREPETEAVPDHIGEPGVASKPFIDLEDGVAASAPPMSVETFAPTEAFAPASEDGEPQASSETADEAAHISEQAVPDVVLESQSSLEVGQQAPVDEQVARLDRVSAAFERLRLATESTRPVPINDVAPEPVPEPELTFTPNEATQLDVPEAVVPVEVASGEVVQDPWVDTGDAEMASAPVEAPAIADTVDAPDADVAVEAPAALEPLPEPVAPSVVEPADVEPAFAREIAAPIMPIARETDQTGRQQQSERPVKKKRTAPTQKTKKRRRPATPQWVVFSGTLAFGIAAVLIGGSLAAPLSPALQKLSVLLWYWTGLAVVSAAVWAMGKRWAMTVASLVLATIGLQTLIPSSGIGPVKVETAHTIGWVNLQGSSDGLADVLAQAEDRGADLLVLAELPAGFAAPPRGWAMIEQPIPGQESALAVLTKGNWRATTAPGEPTMARPVDNSVTLVAINASGGTQDVNRQADINRAATRAGDQDTPVIAVGDFGEPAWTRQMQQFAEYSRGRRLRCGGWLGATYSSFGGFFGWAADHAFVVNGSATQCDIGQSIKGSKHKPLWIGVPAGGTTAQ